MSWKIPIFERFAEDSSRSRTKQSQFEENYSFVRNTVEQDDLLKCQGVLIIGQVLSSVIEEVSAINSNVVVIDDLVLKLK